MALLELDPVDRNRRRLLAIMDDLLEAVETLRLADREDLPTSLQDSIRQVQTTLPRRSSTPTTVKAAHDLILGAQQRLMAANPRNATPRTHPGRGGGQFVTARLSHGQRWKLLALPPHPPQGGADAWVELLEGTVERARDRWEYAQQRAVKAAREGRETNSELELARAAWENYWELREEAVRLIARASAERLLGGSSSRRVAGGM